MFYTFSGKLYSVQLPTFGLIDIHGYHNAQLQAHSFLKVAQCFYSIQNKWQAHWNPRYL